MPGFSPDPALFEPVLTAEDDAAGFHRPWRPWAIVFATFFFGFTAGGTLLALNFRRLGLPRRVPLAIILTLVVSLGYAAGATWLLRSPEYSGAGPRKKRVLRLLRKVVWVVPAIGLAILQRRRYRLFSALDLPPGRYREFAFWGVLFGGAGLDFLLLLGMVMVSGGTT